MEFLFVDVILEIVIIRLEITKPEEDM